MHTRFRRLLILGVVLVAAWVAGLVLLIAFALVSVRELLFALAAVGAVVLVAGGTLGAFLLQSTRARERARGTRMTHLERRVEQGPSQDHLTAVRVEVAALQGDLDTLEGLADVADKRAHAAEERAQALERAVETLGLARLSDRSALEELAGTLGRFVEIEAATQDLQRRLESLDDLAQRVPAVEARVEATASARQLKALDARLAKLETRLAASPSPQIMTRAAFLVDGLVALGARQGLTLTDVVTPELASYRVAAAVERGEPLAAIPFLNAYPSLIGDLTNAEARTLLRRLRGAGYLGHSVALIEEIARRMQKPRDVETADIYRSELALYQGGSEIDYALPTFDGSREGDVILHLVGKALPQTQSGYTLRTQYTVEAQQRVSIRPVVAVHSGSAKAAPAETQSYEHNGVTYFELAGPERGRAPWDEWLRDNVEALAAVVRDVRPAVLHAHSDFMNVLIALPVARAYGIPLVNETRGFWEESWLSRAAKAEGWDDLDVLTREWGLPDMYRLRVEREAEARSASDAVVTLARVMEQHIRTVGEKLGLRVPQVRIAPNAVDAEGFTTAEADAELRASLGLAPTERVVGYISSIVEYEGIDTLVRAMHLLEESNARLLVVGDGPELGPLRELAESLGLTNAIFTGRVPHEFVHDYYALIDLFVVPRKAVAVTELVTPLKPFEAMASGLPCLFSDVGALAEIAEDSGAAALFRAGDADDLAQRLRELLADPERLQSMSSRGLAWVRESRTWDVNAATYLDLYRSLGADIPHGVEA